MAITGRSAAIYVVRPTASSVLITLSAAERAASNVDSHKCSCVSCSVDSMSGFRVQMNTVIFSIHHMGLVTDFVFGNVPYEK